MISGGRKRARDGRPAGARDAGFNGGIGNAEAHQGGGGGDGVFDLMLAANGQAM